MNSSDGHTVSSPPRLAMAPPTPSSRRMPLRPHVGFLSCTSLMRKRWGAWEASQERDRLVQEARKFSTPDVQRATGLETWFVLPGQRAIVPPPRWKMLLVTLIGAYPLVVLLSAFVLPSLEGWPLLVRAAVVPVVLLSLMTYLVMPQLTRLLSGWLYPNQRRPATR